jgi:hypothetical protein
LVKDLDIHINKEAKVVENIITEKDGKEVKIPVGKDDYVIVTTGSMTEDTFYGDNKIYQSLLLITAQVDKVPDGNYGKTWLPNLRYLVILKNSVVTSKNLLGNLLL